MTRSVFNFRRAVALIPLSYDSFNRADSTTSLGVTDGAGLLDPLTWTQQAASTWGILGNRVYTSTPAAGSIATVDLGVADVDISLTLSVIGNTNGLCLRFSNTSNYWALRNNGGSLQLGKFVAGGPLNIVVQNAGNSDGDIIRVVVTGSSWICYRNGTQVMTATDSFNSTATKHGLYIGNSSVSRLDDWLAFAA